MPAKLNKVLKVALTSVLMMAMPVMSVSAQTTPSITFDPSVLTAKPGEQLTVDIVVNHATDTNVVSLSLSSDGNAKFVSVNEASSVLAVNKVIADGTVSVDLAKTGSNFTEGEVIGQLVFSVQSEGVTRISTDTTTMVGSVAVSQSFLETTVSSTATTTVTPTSVANATPTTATTATNTLDPVVIGALALAGVLVIAILVIVIRLMRKPKEVTF